MTSAAERLRRVDASERVLLLPHCLRRSESCRAKYGRAGLECQRCNPDCPVNRLTGAAIRLGYKGICVAPGGRLAVNYVKKMRPGAVVAVACDKELDEGVRGLRAMAAADPVPVIVVIPLARDGCIDTEVDEAQALEMIAFGCSPELIREVV
jgi:uncharacterized protein